MHSYLRTCLPVQANRFVGNTLQRTQFLLSHPSLMKMARVYCLIVVPVQFTATATQILIKICKSSDDFSWKQYVCCLLTGSLVPGGPAIVFCQLFRDQKSKTLSDTILPLPQHPPAGGFSQQDSQNVELDCATTPIAEQFCEVDRTFSTPTAGNTEERYRYLQRIKNEGLSTFHQWLLRASQTEVEKFCRAFDYKFESDRSEEAFIDTMYLVVIEAWCTSPFIFNSFHFEASRKAKQQAQELVDAAPEKFSTWARCTYGSQNEATEFTAIPTGDFSLGETQSSSANSGPDLGSLEALFSPAEDDFLEEAEAMFSTGSPAGMAAESTKLAADCLRKSTAAFYSLSLWRQPFYFYWQ